MMLSLINCATWGAIHLTASKDRYAARKGSRGVWLVVNLGQLHRGEMRLRRMVHLQSRIDRPFDPRAQLKQLGHVIGMKRYPQVLGAS